MNEKRNTDRGDEIPFYYQETTPTQVYYICKAPEHQLHFARNKVTLKINRILKFQLLGMNVQKHFI